MEKELVMGEKKESVMLSTFHKRLPSSLIDSFAPN